MPTSRSTLASGDSEADAQNAALMGSGHLLRSAFDALSSHIAILDEHGTIIEVNAAWNRFASENDFIGVDHGVGDNYLRVCDSASGSFTEGASTMAAGIRAVMAGQTREFQMEYPCHSPHQQRWFVARATRFGGDGPVRVVVAHEDITTPKQNEDHARRALEHGHRLHQIKSSFVTMVSHEFRTPLSVINTAAHLLGSCWGRMSGEDRSAQLQEIQRAVERMTQMMEDLLVHERIEAGKMECKPSRVDMEMLCRRGISDVLNHSPSCSIECAVDPAAREALLDEKLLRHILGNLLSNAVKYSSDNQTVTIEVKRVRGNTLTHADAGTPRVRADVDFFAHNALPRANAKTPPEDHIQLKVSDSGIGIPAAHLPKLYQTFQRASNVGNRAGTGMGLAIVRQCVDLHRGTVRVESIEGKGTTFWVWLPIASPDVPGGLSQTKSYV